MLKHNILPLSDKRRIAFYSSLSGYQCFCSCESCCTRLITPWRVLFALRAIISWHNVNKVLTENTPKAYLTGEACLARDNRQWCFWMNNRNICNTCAPHTAGEACLTPTIAPKARTINSLTLMRLVRATNVPRKRDRTRALVFFTSCFFTNSYNALPVALCRASNLTKTTKGIDPNKKQYFCHTILLILLR